MNEKLEPFFEMNAQEIFPDLNLLKVNRDNILRGLGMKRSDADDYLLNLIEELIQQNMKLAQPRAGFTIFNHPVFNLESKQLKLNDKIFEIGKTVTALLKKSEGVVVFACTIGDEVEKASKEQMRKGNSLEGFILDLMGSELAENVADYLHGFLEEKAKLNSIGVTNRFSPGYCNWPVSAQHDLFSLLEDKNCDIQLTPTSLMLPIKSVSGILGFGKGLRRVDYKCRLCDDEKCILRKQ